MPIRKWATRKRFGEQTLYDLTKVGYITCELAPFCSYTSATKSGRTLPYHHDRTLVLECREDNFVKFDMGFRHCSSEDDCLYVPETEKGIIRVRYVFCIVKYCVVV